MPGDRRVALALAAAAVALAVTASSAAGQQRALRITFVGDSVAASLDYVTPARSRLSQGLDVRFDLKVCRRLVQPSCEFQGRAPSNALQAVKGYGHSLGAVLVVDVGYNEDGQGYREGIDLVMRAALRDGARGVVWVTLRESEIYHSTNVAIRAAAKRWPQLVVADWSAYSTGKPWFIDDGLHLTPTGATALAGFLRPFVLKAAAV